jgi:uncharacterized protein (DUF4415 family)
MSKRSKSKSYTAADLRAVSDNPRWTKSDFAKAKPFAEALPQLAASLKRSRGRPRLESPKQAVTLRLDPSTLDKFKATGEDWRVKMAKTLDRAKV